MLTKPLTFYKVIPNGDINDLKVKTFYHIFHWYLSSTKTVSTLVSAISSNIIKIV